jgi:hypothetical protein
MVKIRVTEEEVKAARIEVQAFQSAGLTPEPLVEQLAATKLPKDDNR